MSKVEQLEEQLLDIESQIDEAAIWDPHYMWSLINKRDKIEERINRLIHKTIKRDEEDDD